jgi:hypothetical protein
MPTIPQTLQFSNSFLCPLKTLIITLFVNIRSLSNLDGKDRHVQPTSPAAAAHDHQIPRVSVNALVVTMTSIRTLSLLPAFSVLIVVSLFYLLVAPYTKVEESFTLHAVWDILTHGRDISKVSL